MKMSEGKWERRRKMEKSSLNIKSFRNLLSNQSKNYKIAPNNYRPTEVKHGGISEDSTSSRSIEDIYSIKLNKVDSSSCDSDVDRRKLTDIICGSFIKFVGNYNSSFCLTVLTPVACRYSESKRDSILREWMANDNGGMTNISIIS